MGPRPRCGGAVRLCLCCGVDCHVGGNSMQMTRCVKGCAVRPDMRAECGTIVTGGRKNAHVTILAHPIRSVAWHTRTSRSPQAGAKITMQGGKLQVPDNPIIPFVEGDGTGRDIWRASVRVFDAAVEKAYKGKRKIHWMEVYAGEKAFKLFKSWLPDETTEAFREFLVGIKGPLTTPIGGGIRSLNVALRKHAGPVRLPAPDPLLPGRALAGETPRVRGHGDLPGEHGGYLRRHGVRAGHGGERQVQGAAQGSLPGGIRQDALPGDQRHRPQAGLAWRARSGWCARPSTGR